MNIGLNYRARYAIADMQVNNIEEINRLTLSFLRIHIIFDKTKRI